MFNIFKSKNKTPLNEEIRKWAEEAILWLEHQFPEFIIEKMTIYTPDDIRLAVNWNNDEDSLHEVLKFIANKMQISMDEIRLDVFKDGIEEINSGTTSIYLENDVEELPAAGLYFEKDETGKYIIAIEEKQLNNIDSAVATIVHELAHVKLLGEERLDENDEHLTDLTTAFFGFGIFGANECFQYHQSSRKWGYSYLGYMNQEEWAYVLALLAFIQEDDHPEWCRFLNPTVGKDFDRSLQYMLNNVDEIFRFEDE